MGDSGDNRVSAMWKPGSHIIGSTQRCVALVLAGGESLRMGKPKAFVHLNGIPLIEHVVERLVPIFSAVYIVGRDIEGLSYLGLPVIEDVGPRRGPLMGLYSGLIESDANWCFAVGCDMPFLSAAVIDYMAATLDEGDIVAAKVNGRVQPLHAFYSRRCMPTANRLLGLRTTSLMAMMAACRVTVIPEADLARLDPGLLSFRDLDTPAQVASLNGEKAPRLRR